RAQRAGHVAERDVDDRGVDDRHDQPEHRRDRDQEDRDVAVGRDGPPFGYQGRDDAPPPERPLVGNSCMTSKSFYHLWPTRSRNSSTGGRTGTAYARSAIRLPAKRATAGPISGAA